MNEDAEISVIGMGCMVPGADKLILGEFWKVLVNGEDNVRDIPLERFIYDTDPDNPYKTNVKKKKAGLVKR